MKATLLPIVERELRVASRRPWTYRSRYLAAIVATILGCGTLLTAQARYVFNLGGHGLLTILALLVFVYTGVAGTQLTCDCLSRERRDGTLGLLFLTDLQDYDVVLGKLVACTLNACYGLFAVMPVLAVSLVLGGTTNGEFCRVALVSANLLFLFSAIGMFASSITRRDQVAPVAAIALAAAVVLAAPLLHFWLASVKAGYDERFLRLFFPIYGCDAAFESRYLGDVAGFWGNAVITQIYGWTFLLLACRRLRVSWQDEIEGPRAGSRREKWLARMQGRAGPRQASRNRLLEINPFLFRATRSRVKRAMPWIFVAAMGVLWFATGKILGLGIFDNIKDAAVATLLHLGLKLWVAGDGFRCLAGDRRTGALELLLTTPLSGVEIVQGQRRALWRRFTGPGLAVWVMDVVFMVAAVRHAANANVAREWIGFYVASMLFLILDMSSLGWIGMRIGMSSRRPYRTVIFWFGGMAMTSTVICFLVAACCSLPDNGADMLCFAAFMVAVPATFHLMYSSVPQIALRERFLEIARESDGQMPAAALAN